MHVEEISLDHASVIIAPWRNKPEVVTDGLSADQAAYVRNRLYLPIELRWNRRFTRLLGRYQSRLSLIELSTNYDWRAMPGAFVNTVLHEYAHHLEGTLEGRKHHGPIWKRIFLNMGGTGERCSRGAILNPGVKRTRQSRVWVRCENWCRSWRRPKGTATRWKRRHWCRDCGGTIVATNVRGARRCLRVPIRLT